VLTGGLNFRTPLEEKSLEVQFLKSHQVAIRRETLRDFAKMNRIAGSDFARFQRED
jgi:hypothetical protein